MSNKENINLLTQNERDELLRLARKREDSRKKITPDEIKRLEWLEEQNAEEDYINYHSDSERPKEDIIRYLKAKFLIDLYLG